MPIVSLIRKVRDSNERKVRRLFPILSAVNHWSAKMKDLSDGELRAKTPEFKRRLAQGETADQVLPEAFALVREAARRTVGLYPFDVQVLGGIVLHQRRIAEMKTGEGKTLVATMPAYLNALVGKVHIVTVNDYLARRDRHWMGPIYEFLGLTVGLLQEDTPPDERKKAYRCDIVYGTNAQFGFDYLRDHMVLSREQKVQGPLDYAIIDEVDYILIDEARTPLIISGPTEETARMYREFARLARLFKWGEDFEVDEEHRRLSLTERGWEKAEKLLKFENIADPRAAMARYHLETALKALVFYKRDQDYIVKDGRVIIVDEFTGRLMPDRRYSGGLHQALEAKEGLPIQREHQTLAQITIQHYFRLYKGLAGMTGTAKTEEEELKKIYGLDVVQIPTNRPMIRYSHPDVIYRTRKAKFEAVAQKVEELHRQGQPVLIGTTSIEDSEYLSELLKRRKLPHQVLNAKHHEKEAMIVAQAGRYGTITIATNMAGRGTDILLGGNPEYRARQEADPQTEPQKYQELLARYRREAEEERKKIVQPADPRSPYGRWVFEQVRKWCRETGTESRSQGELEIYQGGLFVLGCQRHEARRIDDQLAGRAGRQGDPGQSQFFLSLEDDLLRIFGGERLAALMERLGVKEGEAITHDLLTRSIRRAQKRVEERNFEIRKRLLEYDEIMAKQRDAIYALRERFLFPAPGEDPLEEELREHLGGMAEEFAELLVERYVPRGKPPEDDSLPGLLRELAQVCDPVPELRAKRWEDLLRLVQEALKEQLNRQWERLSPHFPVVARLVVLRTVDENWRQHLLELDELREGIGLRAYGGTDPLVEFKREAHRMFEELLVRGEEQVMRVLLSPRLMVRVEGVPALAAGTPAAVAPRSSSASSGAPFSPAQPSTPSGKVGRNAPCPCGSGKKYKHCCGKKR